MRIARAPRRAIVTSLKATTEPSSAFSAFPTGDERSNDDRSRRSEVADQAVRGEFVCQEPGVAGWHYRRDPTHVVFYREATLRWIAAARGWTCDIPAKDIALMNKPEDVTAA